MSLIVTNPRGIIVYAISLWSVWHLSAHWCGFTNPQFKCFTISRIYRWALCEPTSFFLLTSCVFKLQWQQASILLKCWWVKGCFCVAKHDLWPHPDLKTQHWGRGKRISLQEEIKMNDLPSSIPQRFTHSWFSRLNVSASFSPSQYKCMIYVDCQSLSDFVENIHKHTAVWSWTVELHMSVTEPVVENP